LHRKDGPERMNGPGYAGGSWTLHPAHPVSVLRREGSQIDKQPHALHDIRDLAVFSRDPAQRIKDFTGNFVRAHRGEILFESHADRGTIFAVPFPHPAP